MPCRQAYRIKHRQGRSSSRSAENYSSFSQSSWIKSALHHQVETLYLLHPELFIHSKGTKLDQLPQPHSLSIPNTSLLLCWTRVVQYPRARNGIAFPHGGRRPLMLPGPPGCCPGGLHLLASWVAVAWVPKLHLLHLLPKHKISSDFVSFPLVPTWQSLIKCIFMEGSHPHF